MMEMKVRLQNILDAVLSLRDTEELIGIFPHLGADGDALGSGLGLMLALRSLGLRADLLLDEEPTEQLEFLPRLDLVTVYTPEMLEHYRQTIKLAIAVDCHQAYRMGLRGELFESVSVRAIIDHHVHEGDYGELAVIKASASSTAELIFDFIELLEQKTGQKIFNRDIAISLLVGLITDTGRFSFPSTTARCFEQMARLIAYRPDLTAINYELYERVKLPQVLLRGEVLSRIKASPDHKVITSSIPGALLEQTGAGDYDLDTLPSAMRDIEGVEVAFLLREAGAPDVIKINIRSKACFDAAAFAIKYGGGGHVRAAGVTLKGISLAEAEAMVMREASKILQTCSEQGDK